jgi:hypothetical protein
MYINIEQILVLFFAIMKFMLLPNDYSRLKILGNGILGRFEKKFNMLTTSDLRVAHFALFPLGGKTLPFSSFPILTSGLVDF